MKRTALLAHLTANGCVFAREGGSHSIWKNPATGEVQAVPRHLEVKTFTVHRKLNVPVPKGV